MVTITGGLDGLELAQLLDLKSKGVEWMMGGGMRCMIDLPVLVMWSKK